MQPLKILFMSAEVNPFAKSGGLADVGGSLPKALRLLGHDVRVVMPAYASIEAQRDRLETMPPFRVPLGFGSLPTGVFRAYLPNSDVPIYFIAESNLFNRPFFYGYQDDAYRFAFYSRAALELAVVQDWKPDILHCHDWHTAAAITWLATSGQAYPFFQNIPSLYTIHNLAHQGRGTWTIFDYLGIQAFRLNEESYDQVNFMARGIFHSTLINTVSPTYAREILTPEGGAGMDGLLRMRAYDVHGIVNGLDYDEWDPGQDKRLAQPFDADHLAERAANKRALQARAGLPQRPDVPLVTMISRLDWQKGMDITGHVIHMLLNDYAGEAQFIVLGNGNPEYHAMFRNLASYHNLKMAAYFSYEPNLAPLIYGGGDIFLMPSLFEPCGLGQLIAMRYGSVPVVRLTGGLVDTVQDGVTGFTFNNFDTEAFWQALQRAIYIYRSDPQSWAAIQRNGMMTDHTWSRSARSYQQLYGWALARVRGIDLDHSGD
jgi:starch synthase